MKGIKLLATALVFVIQLSAQKVTPLQKLLQIPELKHASAGIAIKDENGKIISQHDADKLLTPASTMKTVTTASALELLGADFRYKTVIAAVLGDTITLVIKGSGDPTLGSEFLGKSPDQLLIDWTQTILKQPFAKKPIRILADDSLFGYSGVSPDWTWEDIGNYYASGTYGISFMDNTLRLTFNTTNGKATLIGMHPELPLDIDNRLTLNRSGQDNGYIFGTPLTSQRQLMGDIPADRQSFTLKAEIPNPAWLLARSWAEALRKVGCNVTEFATTQTTPRPKGKSEFVFTHLSPPLSEIVRNINVRSNNHFAEHLIRTLGAKQPNDEALKKGIEAVSNWQKSCGADPTALVMLDGSGLSPMNGITPNYLTNMLLRNRQRSSFVQSIPLAGKEGTVRNFLKGTKLEGKIRLKSGSIAGVQCYTGYYSASRRTYAVTVMVNRFSGKRWAVQRAIEQFLVDTLP